MNVDCEAPGSTVILWAATTNRATMMAKAANRARGPQTPLSERAHQTATAAKDPAEAATTRAAT